MILGCNTSRRGSDRIALLGCSEDAVHDALLEAALPHFECLCLVMRELSIDSAIATAARPASGREAASGSSDQPSAVRLVTVPQ